MRRIEEASAVGAGKQLLAYIRKHHGTIPAFCDEHGIVRQKLQKAVRGKCRRIDVDFALAVERATGGEIAVAAWATSAPRASAAAAPPQPEPRRARRRAAAQGRS